jgi:hypothetical protein
MRVLDPSMHWMIGAGVPSGRRNDEVHWLGPPQFGVFPRSCFPVALALTAVVAASPFSRSTCRALLAP